MVVFFDTRGEFGERTAVDYRYLFGAEALRGAGGVHRDVAAADDDYLIRLFGGGVEFRELIAVHEVDSCEVLGGGVYAVERGAGDALEVRRARADRDVTGVIFFHDLLHGDRLADDDVAFDIYAELLHRLDLHLDDLLGETEFGDAVDEDAAGRVKGFEYLYFVAHLREVASDGEA